MSPEERQLLTGLFERTRSAAATPRDAEAEAMIADAVRAQPHVPYVLAQTVIVQEEGLKAAVSRIQELEARVEELEAQQQAGAGSFLGGLFGGGQPRPGPARTGSGVPAFGANRVSAPPPPERSGGPWGAPPAPGMMGGGMPGAGMGGGGFLRNAMATAAGVAGGALLFSGIQSLFASHGSGILQQAGAGETANLGDALSGAGGTESLAGGAGEDLLETPYADENPGADEVGFEDEGGFDDGGDGGWA